MHIQTIQTYDKAAAAIAAKFKAAGPRVADIDLVFELSENRHHARVLELGCGDGVDAPEIAARADWYLGVDASEGLLAIARQRSLDLQFQSADILAFEFPHGLDIVFAFATLLHLSEAEVKVVLERSYAALNSGGVLYTTFKQADAYTMKTQKDEFGERQFYYYSPELVQKLAGDNFEMMYLDFQHLRGVDWFSVVFKKP